jgi:xylulokinase
LHKAILALDIGTSRTRARLFDLQGEVLDEASRPTATESPFSGAAELDCEALWRDLVETASTVRTAGLEVVALGATAQLGTIFIDESGDALQKAMLWADTRAQAEAQEFEQAFGEAAYAVSRRRMAPELAAPRLLWLSRQRPDVFRRLRRIASIKDFVVEKLTGAVVTDETHASYTGLFDVEKRSWSADLMERAKCDSAMFAPVRTASAKAGGLGKAVATQLGLAPGIPVAIGAPDGTAGTIGAGAIRPGITVDVAGTTDVLLHCLERPVRDPERRLVLNAHAAAGTWAAGGPTGFTGGAVSWALKLLGFQGPAESQKALHESLSAVAPGCDGLVFCTSLTGSRFPHWNAGERGALSGIEPRHGPLHVLRAAQEGAAFIVADAVDAIQRCGADVSEVVTVGGLAADRAAIQLRADALDIRIVRLATEEASSAGSAMLSGVCANVYPDLDAAARVFVKVRDTIEPGPAAAELRLARARWREAHRVRDARSAGAGALTATPSDGALAPRSSNLE